MLSRHKRLRASEVDTVLSRGKSIRGGHLSMKFLQNKEPFRLAVIVPKSLARKATLRNKLRRAAYDSIGTSLPPSSKGHALFFVRSIPMTPLRTIFKEEATALLTKI